MVKEEHAGSKLERRSSRDHGGHKTEHHSAHKTEHGAHKAEHGTHKQAPHGRRMSVIGKDGRKLERKGQILSLTYHLGVVKYYF